jgi:hypothetical protein
MLHEIAKPSVNQRLRTPCSQRGIQVTSSTLPKRAMAVLTQALASLRPLASSARHARRRSAGALVVKAAKADSNQGSSIAVAVAAPVAAVALSSALISSGAISTADIEVRVRQRHGKKDATRCERTTSTAP